MPSEVALSTNHEPEKGLPPVAPPSGKFIAQLFLVPLLIVSALVLVVFGLTQLVNRDSDPHELLARLENENADVRWRAANEFVQRLKRDDRLASDPQVALRLADLLRRSLKELSRAEEPVSEADHARQRKTLREKRNDVTLLSACLGNLVLPTGAPLLCEVATAPAGREPKTEALIRRQAVWALGNLGQNLPRFRKLSPERVAEVLAQLRDEAADRSGESAEWARFTRDYLEGKTKKTGVIPALAECAKADDPFLRSEVALALNFWDGDAGENALAEKTLLALSYDDGHGTRVEVGEND